MVAILALAGGLEVTGSVGGSALISICVWLISFICIPTVFYLKTGQLGAMSAFRADINGVAGYVQWPLVWPHSLFETPLVTNWAEVAMAQLRPVAWVYALDNHQLELSLKNGRHVILRLPKMTQDEWALLRQALARIADRRSFRFSEAPQIGPDRSL